MDGWVGGWVDGWVGVKAVLRIAYSNKKLAHPAYFIAQQNRIYLNYFLLFCRPTTKYD
jgi:hypothetical protein